MIGITIIGSSKLCTNILYSPKKKNYLLTVHSFLPVTYGHPSTTNTSICLQGGRCGEVQLYFTLTGVKEIFFLIIVPVVIYELGKAINPCDTPVILPSAITFENSHLFPANSMS